MTKVSVIIILKDNEGQIEDSLTSVCNQSLKDVEIICADLGSSDSTLEKVKEAAGKDSRVKLIEMPGSTEGEALNRALAEAEGEYVHFLLPGDTILPYSYECIVAKAARYSADCIKFCCPSVKGAGKKVYQDSSWMQLGLQKGDFGRVLDIRRDMTVLKLCKSNWSGIYRREFLEEKNISFLKGEFSKDKSFFYKVVLEGARIVPVLDNVLMHVNESKTALAADNYRDFAAKEESVRCITEEVEKAGISYETGRAIVSGEFNELFKMFKALFQDAEYGEKATSLMKKILEDYPYGYLYNMRRMLECMLAGAECDLKVYSSGAFGKHFTSNELFFHKRSEEPKVSVVVPVYNQEEYLNLAMDSLLRQTLEDIEIICVNDGSTDSSMAILKQYENIDKRIVIIDKKNTGYGNTMNIGMDAARGDYVGILEPDDFVVPEMFEKLYEIAAEHDLDMVKADHYRFSINPDGSVDKSVTRLTSDLTYYDRLVDPSEETETINFVINTWSGIYKREFLNKNGIRHHESPGASFQDNGLWFQTFVLAKRAWFVRDAYYMYRRDNPNASVYSRGKFYAITNEYKFIWDFLQKEEGRAGKYEKLFYKWELTNFVTTYRRLDAQMKQEYLQHTKEIFEEPLKEGKLSGEDVGFLRLKKLEEIVADPQSYYDKIRVSVILPVYEDSYGLDRCLNSILMKDEVRMEVLILDCGMTDAHREIVGKYAEGDERVILVGGLSEINDTKAASGDNTSDTIDVNAIIDKRNRDRDLLANTIGKARGEYIALLDADTEYDPEMLRTAYDRGYLWDADMVSFWAAEMRPDGKNVRDAHAKNRAYWPIGDQEVLDGTALSENAFNILSDRTDDKLFKKSYIEKLGLVPSDEKGSRDPAFVYTAMLQTSTIAILERSYVLLKWNETDAIMRDYGMMSRIYHDFADALRSAGLYEKYERAYDNYVLHSAVDTLKTVSGTAYEDLYVGLYGLLKELGIIGKPGWYFYDQGDMDELRKIYEYSKDAYKREKSFAMTFKTEDQNKRIKEQAEQIESLEQNVADLEERNKALLQSEEYALGVKVKKITGKFGKKG